MAGKRLRGVCPSPCTLHPSPFTWGLGEWELGWGARLSPSLSPSSILVTSTGQIGSCSACCRVIQTRILPPGLFLRSTTMQITPTLADYGPRYYHQLAVLQNEAWDTDRVDAKFGGEEPSTALVVSSQYGTLQTDPPALCLVLDSRTYIDATRQDDWTPSPIQQQHSSVLRVLGQTLGVSLPRSSIVPAPSYRFPREVSDLSCHFSWLNRDRGRDRDTLSSLSQLMPIHHAIVTATWPGTMPFIPCLAVVTQKKSEREKKSYSGPWPPRPSSLHRRRRQPFQKGKRALLQALSNQSVAIAADWPRGDRHLAPRSHPRNATRSLGRSIACLAFYNVRLSRHPLLCSIVTSPEVTGWVPRGQLDWHRYDHDPLHPKAICWGNKS